MPTPTSKMTYRRALIHAINALAWIIQDAHHNPSLQRECNDAMRVLQHLQTKLNRRKSL